MEECMTSDILLYLILYSSAAEFYSGLMELALSGLEAPMFSATIVQRFADLLLVRPAKLPTCYIPHQVTVNVLCE
jgi:hypothetical protein